MKRQIELKWAIAFVVLQLAWMVLERLVGLHDEYIGYHLYLTNLFAIPAVIFIVMALKDKKKNAYHGRMTYLQGLVSGIVLSLIVALLAPLTQWVTSYVITPDYFTNVIEYSLETGYFESREQAEANFSYRRYAYTSAIGALVMGTLTTAIAMIFIRSRGHRD